MAALLFISPLAAEQQKMVSPVFLKPVVENGKRVFETKNQRQYPVLEEMAGTDAAVQNVTAVLSTGMPQISLKLDAWVKNFMLRQINNGAQDTRNANIFREPLYICLMEGGNMPKQGFFLKKPNELADKTDVYFIEMYPQAERFEKIFSHEEGHLLDAYITDFEFQYTPSRPVHTIPAVTDFNIAYNEGWGEHFEIMTIDLTQNAQLKRGANLDDLKGRSYFLYIGDLLSISQSMKRYSWVKSNLFAFRRNPNTEALRKETAQTQFYYNWTNYNFLGGELKNAQQMLSCEGVVSHIFYQMAQDSALQNRYMKQEFYEQFLDGDAGDFKSRISPQENLYLKMLYAKYSQFSQYKDIKPKTAGPLFLDFIATYIKLFPEDANDVLLHFGMGTFLTSVRKDAQTMYKAADIDAHLMIHDMEAAQKSIQALFKTVQDTITALKADNPALYANIGAPLWIENDKFQPVILGEKLDSFSINLNAAEEFELMTLPGMNAQKAAALVEYRDANGYFSDIADLKKAGVLSAGQYKELQRMREVFKSKSGN